MNMKLNELPDSSRVWIYQSNTEFTEDQLKVINNTFEEFTSSWDYHGVGLNAAAEVLYKRFIVIAVDEGVQKAGGCSIDKSVVIIKSIEKEFGVELMNRMNLAYKEGEDILCEKMPDFQRLIREGKITADTVVFNNLVETTGDLKKSWQVPAKESWHKTLF